MYTVQWHALGVASGVYLYRLQVYPDKVGVGGLGETKNNGRSSSSGM
jgi:hypothetical protein